MDELLFHDWYYFCIIVMGKWHLTFNGIFVCGGWWKSLWTCHASKCQFGRTQCWTVSFPLLKPLVTILLQYYYKLFEGGLSILINSEWQPYVRIFGHLLFLLFFCYFTSYLPFFARRVDRLFSAIYRNSLNKSIVLMQYFLLSSHFHSRQSGIAC